eukprot:3505492-Heterocapsa_arctica.AAC.1
MAVTLWYSSRAGAWGFVVSRSTGSVRQGGSPSTAAKYSAHVMSHVVLSTLGVVRAWGKGLRVSSSSRRFLSM